MEKEDILSEIYFAIVSASCFEEFASITLNNPRQPDAELTVTIPGARFTIRADDIKVDEIYDGRD